MKKCAASRRKKKNEQNLFGAWSCWAGKEEKKIEDREKGEEKKCRLWGFYWTSTSRPGEESVRRRWKMRKEIKEKERRKRNWMFNSGRLRKIEEENDKIKDSWVSGTWLVGSAAAKQDFRRRTKERWSASHSRKWGGFAVVCLSSRCGVVGGWLAYHDPSGWGLEVAEELARERPSWLHEARILKKKEGRDRRRRNQER